MASSRSLSISSADRALLHEPYNLLYNPFHRKPVLVHQSNDTRPPAFSQRPFLGPLLFDNNDSDARDHCAAERTFLSWLRLSIYMAVVSVAILISFHLKHQPTELERKVALPFGIVFWLLALGCMGSGLNNYVKTVNRYSRRQALVQSGWGTQVVFTVVAVAIVAACVLFLSTQAQVQK
ncbi:uncharacterized protein MYCFIDRAFT_143681 [Pseudocercospora fijiensis CIRAD86]|uniref:DUF202 domain-containing protein n=1 Tax=Pseudocercospora fijiensis (strain CIRAD86) TaxID=383855 RepID=M3A2B5_PSEFD|nr:uncharacterized protein MYCFIDRAFT_143681 [Pseudocercospora fijiensis CIRAD86]EME78541.1 hypothetical protein MYCFIDRAFT_143681 [Pseudocercospora fijiensis CIRAD86]